MKSIRLVDGKPAARARRSTDGDRRYRRRVRIVREDFVQQRSGGRGNTPIILGRHPALLL